MKQVVKSYRSAINPPYKRGDAVYLFLTLFFIGILVILVLFLQKPQDDRGRAEGGQNDSKSILGEPVNSGVSDKIVVTTDGTTLSNQSIVSVQLDSTLTVSRVNYFKDSDRKPFAIVYEAPFEISLSSIKSGSHSISAQAMDNTGNIYVSKPVVITIQ